MGTVLLLLAALHVAGLLVVMFSITRAPFGYEDEKGFHQREENLSADVISDR